MPPQTIYPNSMNFQIKCNDPPARGVDGALFVVIFLQLDIVLGTQEMLNKWIMKTNCPKSEDSASELSGNTQASHIQMDISQTCHMCSFLAQESHISAFSVPDYPYAQWTPLHPSGPFFSEESQTCDAQASWVRQSGFNFWLSIFNFQLDCLCLGFSICKVGFCKDCLG